MRYLFDCAMCVLSQIAVLVYICGEMREYGFFDARVGFDLIIAATAFRGGIPHMWPVNPKRRKEARERC